MASWKIRREIVNPETELSKVYGTVTTAAGKSKTFECKMLAKTPEQRKLVWDNLHQQFKDFKNQAPDSFVAQSETDLDGRSVE
jgi:hypothetical protein